MPQSGRPAAIHALVAKAVDEKVPAPERLAAFGEVVRRYQHMAYGCAYAMLGDFHLAEDVAQEAFLLAYRKLADLREPRAFAGWLRRIVISECRNQIRRRKIPTASLEALPESASRQAPAPGAAERGDAETKAVAALRTLPEGERLVMALYYVDGYSQDEIGEFLEVPATTVKGRLFRSRKRLRKTTLQSVERAMKSFPLPNGFADLVVRRAASASDLTKARSFLRYRSLYHSEDFASPTSATDAGIFVIGEKDDVIAAGYFNEVPLLIGNTVVTCVRPNCVAQEAWGAPDPTFLLAYASVFKEAKQRNVPLAIVHGSQYDHPFVGYVPSFYYPVATLPCERARAVRTLAVIEEADATQREAAERAWLLDPYAPKVHPSMAPGEIRVVRDPGDVVGYVRLFGHLMRPDAKAMAQKRLDYTLLTDVTVKTREAALAVIRLAAEITEQSGRDTVCMMQSHMTLVAQTMIGLGGTYLLRRSCNNVRLGAQMVAIIDLVCLMHKLEEEFRARFASSTVRDVAAAFSLEMEGQTVGFRAEGGRLSIVYDRQPIHRRLPRWVLTRLYLGYYSGQEVLQMGPLPWDRSDGIVPDELELNRSPLTLPPAEAALLSALFPKMWPVAWPDMDVWAWILGEDHPAYYYDSEITLSDEAKARIETLRYPWLDY